MAQKFPKDIQKVVDQIEAIRKQVESVIKAASRDSAVAKDLQSRLKDFAGRLAKETKGTPVLRNLQDIAKQMTEALSKAQARFAEELDRASRIERRDEIFALLCNLVRALDKLKGNETLHQRMCREVNAVKDAYERAYKERDDAKAFDLLDAMERPMQSLMGRLRDAAKVADVIDGAIEGMFKRAGTAVAALMCGGGVRRVFDDEMGAIRTALDKAASQLNAGAAKSAVGDRLKKLEQHAWRVQDVWSRSRDLLIATEKQLRAAGAPKDLMGWHVALQKARLNWFQHKTPQDMAKAVEAYWQDLNELAKMARSESAQAA